MSNNARYLLFDINFMPLTQWYRLFGGVKNTEEDVNLLLA